MSGLKLVEYLEFDKTQYIDIGIDNYDVASFKIDFQAYSDSGDTPIFGNRTSNSSGDRLVAWYNNSISPSKGAIQCGSSQTGTYTFTGEETDRHTIEVTTDNKLYFDETFISGTYKKPTVSGLNVLLGGLKTNGTWDTRALSGRIYYFKINDNIFLPSEYNEETGLYCEQTNEFRPLSLKADDVQEVISLKAKIRSFGYQLGTDIVISGEKASEVSGLHLSQPLSGSLDISQSPIEVSDLDEIIENASEIKKVEQLEYIQLDKEHWIDTGVTPSSDSYSMMDFELTSSWPYIGMIFGCGWTYYQFMYGFGGGYDGCLAFRYGTLHTKTSKFPSIGERIKVEIKESCLYCDSSLLYQARNYNTGEAGYSAIKLNKCGKEYFADFKVYSIRIDGLDFIPGKIGDEEGLYCPQLHTFRPLSKYSNETQVVYYNCFLEEKEIDLNSDTLVFTNASTIENANNKGFEIVNDDYSLSSDELKVQTITMVSPTPSQSNSISNYVVWEAGTSVITDSNNRISTGIISSDNIWVRADSYTKDFYFFNTISKETGHFFSRYKPNSDGWYGYSNYIEIYYNEGITYNNTIYYAATIGGFDNWSNWAYFPDSNQVQGETPSGTGYAIYSSTDGGATYSRCTHCWQSASLGAKIINDGQTLILSPRTENVYGSRSYSLDFDSSRSYYYLKDGVYYPIELDLTKIWMSYNLKLFLYCKWSYLYLDETSGVGYSTTKGDTLVYNGKCVYSIHKDARAKILGVDE